MKDEGYQVICLLEDNHIVSLCRYKLTNLYYGNHIWVYDLVTDVNKRLKGYGKLLLSSIEKCAKDNKLNYVALSSGLQRTDTHKFYQQGMNYAQSGYVFQKKL